jgi:CBS domain/BON domain
MKARDVMVSPVITVTTNSSVRELAQTLLKNHISGVPVVDCIASKGQLVGIVSRANLIQTVASKNVGVEVKQEDAAIRGRLLAHLKAQQWAHAAPLNVTVNDGVVHLWGVTSSEIEREPIRVAAESTTSSRRVRSSGDGLAFWQSTGHSTRKGFISHKRIQARSRCEFRHQSSRLGRCAVPNHRSHG